MAEISHHSTKQPQFFDYEGVRGPMPRPNALAFLGISCGNDISVCCDHRKELP